MVYLISQFYIWVILAFIFGLILGFIFCDGFFKLNPKKGGGVFEGRNKSNKV